MSMTAGMFPLSWYLTSSSALQHGTSQCSIFEGATGKHRGGSVRVISVPEVSCTTAREGPGPCLGGLLFSRRYVGT